MTWLVFGSYWLPVTNEFLLSAFVKKDVTKGQRQRLKPEKDTKVSTFRFFIVEAISFE